MYTYNVTIKIEKHIRLQWIEWMQNVHIPEVLATKMFTTAVFNELLEPVDEEGDTFVAQYACDNLENYSNYLENHAPLLRQKGFDLFGNRFIAFRSLLKKV
jgi:hypothetical protein